MSTKHLLLTLLAAFSLAWACQRPEAGLSFPTIDLSLTEATVAEPASSFTVHVRSNRAWRATSDAEWIAIDPETGPGSTSEQPVTITVQNNTGFDRTGHVVFDIVYDSFSLPVSQAGLGKPEDFLIYYNDFDLEAATQTYGTSGTSWPYLDQFGGWKNEKGIDVANIEYKVGGLSARTNSSSNGNYSDYEGSGVNNLLFGSSNYFVVKNIGLNGLTNFHLSFGSEKYDNNNKDSNFSTNEFFIYLSDNGQRWVPLSYEFNGTAAGRWNVGEGSFTVPQGTEKLSLYIMTTVSSVYRMDDLKLEASLTAGALLDFSLGIEMNPGGDDQPGGGDTPAGDAKAVTVAEFLAAAESNSQVYEVVGTIGGSINTTYGNFDLTDETGTIYVYGMTATYLGYGAENDKSYASLGLKEGDKIKVRGYRGSFTNSSTGVKKDELLYGWFVEKVTGGGGGTPSDGVPFSKLDPSNFKEGRYVIAYPSGSGFAIMKNAVQSSYYVAATAFDLASGNLPSEEHIFTVAKSGSGFTIRNNEGGYVGVEISGTHYNLKPGLSAAYVWNFTARSDGSIEAHGSDSGEYVLSYDAGHNDFTLFNKTPSYPTFYSVEGVTPGGGDTPGGDTPSGDVQAVTVAQFLAAAESSSQVYELVGTIGGSINTTYGNFDLTDESGTVYVYGMTATNLGYGVDNDKSYASLGLKEGDKIKVRGYRGSFTNSSTGVKKDEMVYGWFVEKVTGGGDTPGGDTPSGNTITWVTNSENQTWAAATDPTYGAGFSATKDGMTVAYYKGSSTSNPVAPNANHIRVYKNSHLSIKVAGKTITGVELTTEPDSGTTSYCFDLSVTGGGTATADKAALKVTWSGSASSFEADTVNGQVRIKEIKVTFN